MRKSIASFVCGFLLCGVVNGALPPRVDLTTDLKLRDSLAAILRKIPPASRNHEEAQTQLATIADIDPSGVTFGMLVRGFNSQVSEILKRKREILQQALTTIPLGSLNYEDAKGQLEIIADMDPSNDGLFRTAILRIGEILEKEVVKTHRAEEPKPSVRPLATLSRELANAFVPLHISAGEISRLPGSQEIRDVVSNLSSLSELGFGEFLGGDITRINVSFNRVKACAERLLRGVVARDDGASHCSLPQLKWALEYFSANQQVHELSSFCRRKIFSVDRGSSTLIDRLLPEMAGNIVGYRRLLSLLTIFSLKANGIRIGKAISSAYLPPIKIEVDSRSSSEFESYCEIKGDNITIRLSSDATASTLEHELTHAFHFLILPMISKLNPSMMDAVFRSFEGQIKIPYDKALFPMFSFSPRIVQGISDALSRVPQQVEKFLEGQAFASILATLKSGGFDLSVGISPGNIQGLAGIIFLYTCCFDKGIQIWVDPEEVLTIYGRVPFRFYGSGGRPFNVEIIDQNSSSSFNDKTILFHEGKIYNNYMSNLSGVFTSLGVPNPLAVAREIYPQQKIMFSSLISDEVRTKLENPALKDIVARHSAEIPHELLGEGNNDKIRAFILDQIAKK